jgi:amidohydrolase
VNGNRIVVNDPTLEPFVLTALSRVGSVKVRGFDLTGEDFYSYSEKRPSAYFMIGAAVPDGIKDGEALYPHHSPLFQIDEQALLFGVRCWLSILQDWLAQ